MLSDNKEELVVSSLELDVKMLSIAVKGLSRLSLVLLRLARAESGLLGDSSLSSSLFSADFSRKNVLARIYLLFNFVSYFLVTPCIQFVCNNF